MAIALAPESTLADLEAIVDAGLKAFVKVGNALAEIRDRRLYRATHDTFEAYCQDRFGLKRQRAYELMQASAVVAKVSEISDTEPPSRESHAAALAPLLEQPEQLVEAVTRVRAAKGEDAKAVDYERAVEKVKPGSTGLARKGRLLDLSPVLQRVSDVSGLLIAPNSVGRRLLSVCRDAFEDIGGCISESRRHDASHDHNLRTNRLICQRGAVRSQAMGCGCDRYFLAADRRAEMAEFDDANEDGLIESAWTTAKRLAGAIGKAFTSRRQRAGKGQVTR